MIDGVIGFDPSFRGFAMYDGARSELIKTENIREGLEEFSTIARVEEIMRGVAAFTDKVKAETQIWYVEAPVFGGKFLGHTYQLGHLMCELAKYAKQMNDQGLKTTMLTAQRSIVLQNLFGKTRMKDEDVVQRTRDVYGVSYEKDAGLNRLDAFHMWRYGQGCLAGEFTHYPLARRGKPKARSIQRIDA